jgi:hypothetical protein
MRVATARAFDASRKLGLAESVAVPERYSALTLCGALSRRGCLLHQRVFAAALQEAAEAGAANAEHVRGAHAIAATGFEDALDVIAAHFLERDRAPFAPVECQLVAWLLDVRASDR